MHEKCSIHLHRIATVSTASAVLLAMGCDGGSVTQRGAGDSGRGGSGGGDATGGSGPSGGRPSTGGVFSTGGRFSTGGNAGTGGRVSTGGNVGGNVGGAGGNVTTAGTGGSGARDAGPGGNAGPGGARTGGASRTGGTSGSGGQTALDPLDCGSIGWAVENHGPPANRLNYVIIGDGYAEADLVAGGVFEQHVKKAMAKRFSIPIGEPYSRYRNFVNICAIKLRSPNKICNSSSLGCCGDDESRLAKCNNTLVTQALNANLPASFGVDLRAVMLNGNRWWNSGGITMYWSGGHADAAGAALHEGGHGFHQLADEYTGSGSGCTNEYAEVNSTANKTTTAGKWDLWLNYNQAGATGLQTTLAGSRYCTAGQYRPSDNSMMNMLFGDNPNTSYNSVSREQMIFTIWRAVVPVDKAIPAAGAVDNPSMLEVQVVDPAVIDVDWSVDDVVVAAKGGTKFDVAARGLSPGLHTITAKAYDNAGDEWVRYRTGVCPSSVTGNYCHRTGWKRSQQSVTWTVTIP